MKRIKILLITLMITALSPLQVFADKSDDTLVAAFSRELTQLDYHYGTKTEFLILDDGSTDNTQLILKENYYSPEKKHENLGFANESFQGLFFFQNHQIFY